MASELKVDDIKNSAGAFTQARLVDFKFFQTGEVATGTTVTVYDDTIPQNDEGDQFMSLAFTPKDALNILRIDLVMSLATSASGAANAMIGALFQDSIVDALAAFAEEAPNNNGAFPIMFTHYMIADTTSSITFTARGGLSNGGTTTFNGFIGARRLGGVMASSISVTEFKPD